MDSNEIGLIAAMPEETTAFLKRFPPFQSRLLEAFPYHRLSYGNRTVHLVQSGMGQANARAATSALLALAQPSLLLSIGFAGAIRPGPRVGDLIVAHQMLNCEEGKLSPATGLSGPAAKRMTSLLSPPTATREWRCLSGTFITISHSVTKREMARLVPAEVGHPVLEMESAAVAAAAASAAIPFAALRTVSDAADEELGFTIEEITDNALRLVPAKVALLIMKRPRLIPQFCRLARNSRLAGRNLAEALALYLEALDE